MRYLSAEQMREADRRCIEELGIPGAVLMNNAGRAVATQIDRGPVAIVCGKGNNGGDGFVVARYCLLRRLDTRVLLLADPEEVSGDAATFMNAYRNLGGVVQSVTGDEAVAEGMRGLADCATLVDALLGTGITGAVRGAMRTAIMNWPKVYTVAVDLPSGIHADTGQALGCAVNADVTVTFQFAKAGFRNPAAQEYLGRLIVADIDIPGVCADDTAWERLMAARS